jgi:hypothetical protein
MPTPEVSSGRGECLLACCARTEISRTAWVFRVPANAFVKSRVTLETEEDFSWWEMWKEEETKWWGLMIIILNTDRVGWCNAWFFKLCIATRTTLRRRK